MSGYRNGWRVHRQFECRYYFWPVRLIWLAKAMDEYLTPEEAHPLGMRLWGWMRSAGLLRIELRPRRDRRRWPTEEAES